MKENISKELDDQITVRCATSMRERVAAYANPNTGKPADVARVFIELGLRIAEQHGYHTLIGILERAPKVEFTRETLEKLYTSDSVAAEQSQSQYGDDKPAKIPAKPSAPPVKKQKRA